jgi:DNA-binding transcriptional ArsR family regulator
MIVERSIRDVMGPAIELGVETRARPALELLIGLSTLTAPDRIGDADTWVPALRDCSPALRRDVSRVGDESGKLWLHLLALGEGEVAGLLARVNRLDALELRRYLVGAYVPTWRDLAGGDTLERAAAGDAGAIGRLLAHRRYYGGEARQALSFVLPLPPPQTKRRVLAVLRRFAAEVFEPRGRAVVASLEHDAKRVESLARTLSPEEVIAAATGGYDYSREPEFSRVVLVPHAAARPWLLLCQHGDERIICYPLAGRTRASLDERGVRLGRALGDEQRLRILRRLVAGDASLAELAESAGVAKSTAHHHLALLREAQLVTLHGNARRYWYSLRREALAESNALLAELFTSLEPH